MKLRDMMTNTVVRIHPDETVAVAARMLTHYNIGILPVCGNDGRVVVSPVVGPAPTHYHEYINCAIAGKKAATDFAWSTYMRECVIAGEIAERVQGKKITWDAKARRFDSEAANAFLTRPYRKGWEIPGLPG